MMNVAHIDHLFELTDERLRFEQHQAMRNIRYLIENESPLKPTDLLEMAIEQCRLLTEVIRARQANYDQQAKIAQLDLFVS